MFLSLCAAVTTFLVPLPLLLLLSFGMTAQLPMKSLFWLRTRQVQGNSPGLKLFLKQFQRDERASASLAGKKHPAEKSLFWQTFKKGLKDKSEEKEPPPKKSRKKRAT